MITLTLVACVVSLNPPSLGSKDQGTFFSVAGSVDAVVEARLHPLFFEIISCLVEINQRLDIRTGMFHIGYCLNGCYHFINGSRQKRPASGGHQHS